MPASFIQSDIAEILEKIIEIRHDLHRHPELGLDCVRTARVAAQALREFGCDTVIENIGQTGVVAVIEGSFPSKAAVAYRADMDALPLKELSGVPWSSEVEGMMHACGHDGHVAIALATAYALTRNRDFAGRAVIIIQPGEEGFAGARVMIEDGLFERFPVNEVYAIHGAQGVPLGHFSTKAGPMTAAGDLFRVTVTGKGGHGGRPQTAHDPIVASAALINAFQSIVSRSLDPSHAGVISIGSVHAGSEDGVSVIPDSVKLAGTTRTMNEDDRVFIENRMREVCDGIAKTHRAQIELDYVRMYPALINHETQTQAVIDTICEVAGADVFESAEMAMGAEDFSFMLEKVPGNYFRVGTGDETHRFGQHHPAFDFNDLAIAPAATVAFELIRRRLAVLSQK